MYQAKVSVRSLVEFILREGDLDNTRDGGKDADAMQAGTRLHKKIQKSMPAEYRAEVPLSGTFRVSVSLPEVGMGGAIPVLAESDSTASAPAENAIFQTSGAECSSADPGAVSVELVVEGRADGILAEDDRVMIDEIKCMYMDLSHLQEPVGIHLAQAKCYAYLYASAVLAEAQEQTAQTSGAEAQEQTAQTSDVEAQEQAEKNAQGSFAGEQAESQEVSAEALTEDVPFAEAQQAVEVIPAELFVRALPALEVQMTYCNIDSEEIRRFNSLWQFGELEGWFHHLLSEYAKWVVWEQEHMKVRNESIKGLEFPFPYRTGQKELVTGVYRTILRKKKLFIEAPTGVGKTISTVYPAVKAMGEGLAEKIFYLTAKTITRTVAEETLELLKRNGLKMLAVTITSKEKLCVLGKPDCNPGACERARGHFDRVNDAVFDLLLHEERVDRECILAYAEKHCVCPFEMCLDTATWSDAVIGDYNYAFDPNVYLRRFFDGTGKDYLFLVDEAHNLVDRAREMYSALLIKEEFLAVKRLVKERSRSLANRLEACNKDLLHYKRECDEAMLIPYMTDLPNHLQQAMGAYEDFLAENRSFEGREEVLDLYFKIRHFVNMYELFDEKYQIYAEHLENGNFALHLQCMDPSTNLQNCLSKGRSAVFFSATLLPIRYYREQLGGEEEDYAVYAPSPFQPEKRLVVIGRDVSTRYTRRNQSEYEKIAEYIVTMLCGKPGNYMAFFPSYQYMQSIVPLLAEGAAAALPEGTDFRLIVQKSSMEESEKEEFLQAFERGNSESTGADENAAGVENTGAEDGSDNGKPGNNSVLLACCVMGGIFSEGIDLTGERLIGAAIVGTGIPMVCRERELFRQYYEEKKQAGFEYAYLYGGMNKVLQSGGRVIRTTEDRGVILLLDDRFIRDDHQNLFPREWYPYEVVTRREFAGKLAEFWDRTKFSSNPSE